MNKQANSTIKGLLIVSTLWSICLAGFLISWRLRSDTMCQVFFMLGFPLLGGGMGYVTFGKRRVVEGVVIASIAGIVFGLFFPADG